MNVETVWVMQLDWENGGGWISVHKSPEGAFAMMVKRCAAVGIEIISDNYRDMVQIGELDDEPGIDSYAIALLPVED